jgi:hypothetical protein
MAIADPTPFTTEISDVSVSWSPVEPRINFDNVVEELNRRLPNGTIPLRIVVSEATPRRVRCEITVMRGFDRPLPLGEITTFGAGASGRAPEFTVVMIVPTGIGCSVGGEAGDGTPAARILASVCDHLVLHPNVVNASDINELPGNAWYVEGAALTRFMLGTVALLPQRLNRLLVLVEQRRPDLLTDVAINAVNAARATLGISVGEIRVLSDPFEMSMYFTAAGRASGVVRGVETLVDAVTGRQNDETAVAITTNIAVPKELTDTVRRYYHASDFVNPWGGVEAMLTHAVTESTVLPTAHAPMLHSVIEPVLDVGWADPRKAAEAVSKAFFFCALKGLARAPAMVPRKEGTERIAGALHAEDVGCLVVPDRCIGLPVLAAAKRGTPIVVVDDDNIMAADFDLLDTSAVYRARSYFEAAGVAAAIGAGVDPHSLYRPLTKASVRGARERVGDYTP